MLFRECGGCYAPDKLFFLLLSLLNSNVKISRSCHDSLLHKINEAESRHLSHGVTPAGFDSLGDTDGGTQTCKYACTDLVIHFQRDMHHLL